MTHDELKAAASEIAESEREWIKGCECNIFGDPSCEECQYRAKVKTLADYAAAMLDETPIDRAWLVKLLGETIEEFHGLETWSRDNSAGPWLDKRRDGQVAGIFSGGKKRILETRADALAFFKLVRWPVEPGKILEGAKT